VEFKHLNPKYKILNSKQIQNTNVLNLKTGMAACFEFIVLIIRNCLGFSALDFEFKFIGIFFFVTAQNKIKA
jgi:hypothetical protein